MSAVSLPTGKGDYLQLFSKVKLSSKQEIEEKLKKCQIAQQFCEYLKERGISYSWCIRHPEVISCNESKNYYQRYQEYLGNDYSICKHLLVHERKGEKRVFLIIVDDSKDVDLKELKEQLDCGKLEFVDKEEMHDLLHTVPGNVSLFNIEMDKEYKVNLIIDQELLEKTLLAFHPLYNGMSLFLTPENAIQYLNMIHRKANFMEVPIKKKEWVLEKVI